MQTSPASDVHHHHHAPGGWAPDVVAAVVSFVQAAAVNPGHVSAGLQHSIRKVLRGTTRVHALGLLTLMATALLFSPSVAHAGTHTWVGPANGSWSVAANWTGGVPTTGEVNGTIVVFNSSATSICNIDVTVDFLRFTGTGSTVSGDNTHILRISSQSAQAVNIQNDTGTNGIAATVPVQITGSGPVKIQSLGGAIGLSCNIANASGATNGLRLLGPGNINLLSTASTYTGLTTVASGTTVMASSGSAAAPGNITVGIGTGGTGATLRLLTSNEISNTATVTVESDGTFDVNDLSETVGGLVVRGGTVDIGTGALSFTEGGNLFMTSGSITGAAGSTFNLRGNVTVSSASTQANINVESINLNTSGVDVERLFIIGNGTADPDLAITGDLSETSAGKAAIRKTGAGTIHLLGSGNSFRGTLTIEQGTVATLNSTGTAIVAPVVIGTDTGTPLSATLQSAHSGSLKTTVTLDIKKSGQYLAIGTAEIVDTISGTGRITLQSTASLTVQGLDVIFGGTITGAGTALLNKTGAGLMTLTGASDTVPISVAGALQVDGSLLFNTITLNQSAFLIGKGKVSSVKTLGNLSTIAPGNNLLGFLDGQFGTVNLSSGGRMLMQIDESQGLLSDRMQFTELKAAGGTLEFSVTGALTRNAYIIGTGQVTGSFSSILNQPAGYTLVPDYRNGSFATHLALVKPGIVTTAPATEVQASKARLNGSINPGGKPFTGFFQFGTQFDYGLRTPAVKVTGTADQPLSALVTGLNGGTLYHYQLVASSSDGPVHGQDLTFTTPGPNVSTFAASSILGTQATVGGEMTFNGPSITSVIEFGLTPALGKTKPLFSATGGTSANAFIQLTDLKPATTYFFRVVATNPDGVTRGNILSFRTLAVLPPVFAPFGGVLSDRLRYVGGTTSFSVSAIESTSPTGVPLQFQWFRNGKAIPGATSSVLSLVNLTLAQAGAYTCKVSNLAGSITSSVGQLGMLDTPLPKLVKASIGSTVNLTVKAAGNNLRFVWNKKIDNIFSALDVTSSTLTLKNVQPSDGGKYDGGVALGNDSLNATPFTLQVFDAKPIVFAPVLPPEGIVGGDYDFQIPIDTAQSVAPTSFTVKGLPAGLKVDNNGRITGRITAVQTGDKNYPLTIKATNAKGSSPEVPASLLVHEFPPLLAGKWEGLVNPDPLPLPLAHLNSGLGGALSLTISSQGGYTGRFTLSGASFPVTGFFRTTLGDPAFLLAGAQRFVSTVEVKRKGKSNLRLELAMDVNSPAMDGQLTDLAALTQVSAVAIRHGWSASTPFPDPGPYTLQLPLGTPVQVGDPAFPQGRGFATVNISALGVATIAARVADGVVPVPSTSTALLSVNKGLLLHQQLAANTASLHGNVNVIPDSGTPVNGGKPLLEGFLSWMKNAQPASSKDRAYRNGFTAPMNLQVVGGFYTPPAANTPVLGFVANQVPGQNNARVSFTDGGLTMVESGLLDRPVRISPENLADFSNPAANPTNLNLRLTPATGLFTGSFTLTDGAVQRTAPFAGVLVPRTDVRAGCGFFLLPGLAPTATTSPILSGAALLLPP